MWCHSMYYQPVWRPEWATSRSSLANTRSHVKHLWWRNACLPWLVSALRDTPRAVLPVSLVLSLLTRGSAGSVSAKNSDLLSTIMLAQMSHRSASHRVAILLAGSVL